MICYKLNNYAVIGMLECLEFGNYRNTFLKYFSQNLFKEDSTTAVEIMIIKIKILEIK